VPLTWDLVHRHGGRRRGDVSDLMAADSRSVSETVHAMARGCLRGTTSRESNTLVYGS